MSQNSGGEGAHDGRRRIQVDPGHYWAADYDSMERFASYWHQINAVLRWQPRSALEVGVGNRFVAGYLARRLPAMHTLDHDHALRPSVAGELRSLPLRSKSVDVVLCAEVLEHVPFDVAVVGLGEFARVARRGVVLSVPNALPYYRALLPLPFGGERRLLLTRSWARPSQLTNPQEHYWELGLPEYPVRRLRNAFQDQGLLLMREFRLFENPYHHFFELRPQES